MKLKKQAGIKGVIIAATLALLAFFFGLVKAETHVDAEPQATSTPQPTATPSNRIPDRSGRQTNPTQTVPSQHQTQPHTRTRAS
jgi:hypothetical protein